LTKPRPDHRLDRPTPAFVGLEPLSHRTIRYELTAIHIAYTIETHGQSACFSYFLHSFYFLVNRYNFLLRFIVDVSPTVVAFFVNDVVDDVISPLDENSRRRMLYSDGFISDCFNLYVDSKILSLLYRNCVV